jgi:hypothetical protein
MRGPGFKVADIAPCAECDYTEDIKLSTHIFDVWYTLAAIQHFFQCDNGELFKIFSYPLVYLALSWPTCSLLDPMDSLFADTTSTRINSRPLLGFYLPDMVHVSHLCRGHAHRAAGPT